MATAKTPVKAVRHGVYEIGLGEFNPGDVIPVEHGGTGLAAPGAANQVLGVNADGTGMEYKTIEAGEMKGGVAMTVTHTPGTITLSVSTTNQTGNNLINQLIGVR